MFNPKISVIIPVYNGSDYLSQAINSVLSQTYKNIEIVVVNDGSTDNGSTEDIALSYGNKINYYSQKNGGVSAALNSGIRHMTGDYFCRLSHDDLYYPNKIEEQVAFMYKVKNKKTVLYSDFEYIDSKANFLKPSGMSYIKSPNILHHGMINGCTIFISRDCFNNIGLFDITLKTGQDYDMRFRLMKEYPFAIINRILVKTRIHTKQGSNLMGVTMISDSIIVNNRMLALYNLSKLREIFKKNLLLIIWFYISIYLKKLYLSILLVLRRGKFGNFLSSIWKKFFLRR